MSGLTASAPAAGAVLAGRYEIVRTLARGGMGHVLEAVDRQLDRPVAVKLLHDGGAEHRPRFETEVQLLAGLNHPGLVQVYDAGDDDGCRFVVLELVDGPPLRRILDERAPLPEAVVASLGASLAGALAYVHASGVVHRDVTPGNVLCGSDGRPRLTDFGIARLADASRITATGTTIGTAAYMAPEQVQGLDVTPAADVYALGLILLEALTGRPAFEGTTAEVAVARLVRDPDTSDVPPRWRPLLAAMTARDPGSRPRASAVRDRLAVAVAEVDGEAAAMAPAVGGHAATTVVPAAVGTSIMPTAMVPAASAPPAPSRAGGASQHARPRHVVWGLAAGLAAALLLGLAASSGGGVDVPPTTTLEPVASTDAPTTTAPPTTEAPAVVAPDEDEDDDDDDDDDGGEGRGGDGRGSPPGRGEGRGNDD